MNKGRMTGQMGRVGRTRRENKCTCVKLVLVVFHVPERERDRQTEDRESFMEGRNGSVKFLKNLQKNKFQLSVLNLKCNLV